MPGDAAPIDHPVDNTPDLQVLLASQYPLIYAEARDEERLMAMVRRAATAAGAPVWTWSVTRGLARDGMEAQYQTQDPARAFDFVDATTGPGVFLFADVHHALENPAVVRRIKEIAQRATPGRTVILAAPSRTIPPELEGLVLPWTLRPPGREEMVRLVQRTVDDLRRRRIPVYLEPGDAERFADTLRGLSLPDAERLVQRAALDGGGLKGEDLALVRTAKAEILNVAGVLELIEAEVGTLDQVGGLDGIKTWLERRRAAMEHPDAATLRLDAPRGVLLMGVPGCGKSLIAKSLARTWDLPLVLLDPARLYGSYIGESEQRLDRALRTVEAMAPTVLWIDEIEKGFASTDRGDGGVSRRLLGTFLRWMQDRGDGVFLVATANDVASLPPELLRKGRFDEIFFVDLPDDAARRRILEIHLARRGHDPAHCHRDAMVAATDGYSGAEIEAAVVGALYRVVGAGSTLSDNELLAEIRGTVPLSVTRAEDIAALRAWAASRAQAA